MQPLDYIYEDVVGWQCTKVNTEEEIKLVPRISRENRGINGPAVN